jgi:hypothetical protein
MQATKEQLKESILFFANKYGKGESFKSLLEAQMGLPKIVEMIVYEMFLHKFNSYNCSNEEYITYKIIHEYAIELKEKGFITFEQEPTEKWFFCNDDDTDKFGANLKCNSQCEECKNTEKYL